MIKHFVFLLYLLSYTTGIGAITLGLFLYNFRMRNHALKYFLLTDLFSTMTLSVNTLHYYGSLFRFTDYRWFVVSLVYGMLFFNAGTVGFLSLTVSALVGERISYGKKIAYFSLAGCFLLSILLLQALNSDGIISGRIAALSAFFVSNVFGALIVYYNAIVLWRNREKLTGEIKLMMKVAATAVVLCQSASIAHDLLRYVWSPGYPLAFSPIIYFIVNLIALVFAARYYFGQAKAASSETVMHNTTSQFDSERFCKTYGITEREMEIIRLITAGKSNQDIGEKLYISLNTVRNHIYNIYKKIGVTKRYDLINVLNGTKVWPEQKSIE